MRETKEIRKMSSRVYLLMVLMVIALAQSVVKNLINEKWAKDRDTVACIPEIETHYPGVYLQSAAHPVNNDAKIQNFIEQYVHLTRNEEVIDFHKALSNSKNGRYDKARLSMSKYKAMFMSEGVERKLNEVRYAKSSDIFHYLDQRKMGIVFLIDSIEVRPVPAGMMIPVVVRGQFEAIYDTGEKQNKNLPPDFLGYREIKYLVKRGFEMTDDKDNIENKTGLFVVWSEERTLDPGEKRKLFEQSREFFLHRNDQ